MKYLLIAFVAFTIWSCANHPSETVVGYMRINIEIPGNERIGNERVPASVLLSIVDSKGHRTTDLQQYQLFPFGAGFISESVLLKVGHYQLIEFFVLDTHGKVLYAAPMNGSVMATFVDRPLPLDFAVMAEGTSTVLPQVLFVTHETTPGQFGYVNFGYDVVGPNAKPIKEYEIFVYDHNEGDFIPNAKINYTYQDGYLIKREYRTYWTKSKVYYLDSFELFSYGSDGKLAEVDYYYAPGNVLVDKYKYSYPNEHTIISDLYDGYAVGDPEHFLRLEFTKGVSSYTLKYIEQTGLSSGTWNYLISGGTDSKGNITSENVFS
jgi:hypothetical protein